MRLQINTSLRASNSYSLQCDAQFEWNSALPCPALPCRFVRPPRATLRRATPPPAPSQDTTAKVQPGTRARTVQCVTKRAPDLNRQRTSSAQFYSPDDIFPSSTASKADRGFRHRTKNVCTQQQRSLPQFFWLDTSTAVCNYAVATG